VVSNDLSELARVAAWLNDCVGRFQVPVRTAERLDLCSTEVLTNIVQHGFSGSGAHRILLRLERRDEHMALEIQDDGAPFDPRAAADPEPPASLADAAVGGWGIRIVRHFSDEWHYCRSEGRNQLTLLFRLSEAADGRASRTADEAS
jgi:serine/threonine-protein kinase RsbW